MEKLQNTTIFITGANRGIGKSLVKAALAKGAGKVYAASRDINNLPDFKDNRVIPIELDITNTDLVAHAAEIASDTKVLINNAGVLSPGTILEGDMEGKQKDMEVNYFATINMMRAFVPILEKNIPARIVNVASIAAYSPLPFIAGYAASKAALFSATQAVRIELAKKGITVHAVNPGAIDTDMNKGSEMEAMGNPDLTAKSILDEVEKGILDIIPDDMGKGMYDTWRKEPSKLAAVFHDMYHG